MTLYVVRKVFTILKKLLENLGFLGISFLFGKISEKFSENFFLNCLYFHEFINQKSEYHISEQINYNLIIKYSQNHKYSKFFIGKHFFNK